MTCKDWLKQIDATDVVVVCSVLYAVLMMTALFIHSAPILWYVAWRLTSCQ